MSPLLVALLLAFALGQAPPGPPPRPEATAPDDEEVLRELELLERLELLRRLELFDDGVDAPPRTPPAPPPATR